jgi:uncharacterized protein (DUF2267 family)
MTIPQEYTQASRQFELFMIEARDALGHATTNQTYTTVQAVFFVFRRRLSVRDALAFAATLPAVLRAIFVSDWDVEAPCQTFPDRAALIREAQDFRRDHSFVPDDAIEVVARVLRRHVEVSRFDRMVQALPPAARGYWATEPSGSANRE